MLDPGAAVMGLHYRDSLIANALLGSISWRARWVPAATFRDDDVVRAPEDYWWSFLLQVADVARLTAACNQHGIACTITTTHMMRRLNSPVLVYQIGYVDIYDTHQGAIFRLLVECQFPHAPFPM